MSVTMISVVIPALNEADRLPETVASLEIADPEGLVEEVILVDGGSTDGTVDLARKLGLRVASVQGGRGPQLAGGAELATANWLLFLHADTKLAAGWEDAARGFIENNDSGARAAVFRFRLDSSTPRARRLERAVAWRNRIFRLPYGDQGLLISKEQYELLGGYRPMALMEDVDFIRRIGRRRVEHLPADAITSASRFEAGGYMMRSARNLLCLTLYILHFPLPLVQRLYG